MSYSLASFHHDDTSDARYGWGYRLGINAGHRTAVVLCRIEYGGMTEAFVYSPYCITMSCCSVFCCVVKFLTAELVSPRSMRNQLGRWVCWV